MMMDRIRGAAQHILFKILLGVIILSFVLSGGFYYLGATPTYAVKVNSQEISLQQFDSIYQSRAYMLPEDADQNAEQALKKEIMKGLVDEILFEQYVKSLNVTVSNEQIKTIIGQYPEFLDDNGQFSPDKYRDFLTNQNLTGDQFAEYIRSRELTPVVLQDIRDSLFTLPSEINEYAKLLLQKRTIRKAPIDITSFTEKQTVTPEDVKAFYDANNEKFTLPEAVKASYIQINRTDFLNQVDVSDEAVKTYYQTHVAAKNFAIIQVATKAEAEKIIEALNAGEDFAELAKTKSLDIITKNNGGELGMMKPSEIPQSLAELTKQNLNKVGQISSVINANNQFLVAKLIEIEDELPAADSPEYQTLVTEIKSEKSADIFYDIQSKVSEALETEKNSLEKIAEISGIKPLTTELFDRENAPEAFKPEQVLSAAFSKELIGSDGVPRVNSELISVDEDTVIVFRIEDHRAKLLQPLKEVETQITKDLKLQRASAEVLALADKAIEGLNAAKADALTELNTKFGEPQVLTTNSEDSEYRQDVEFLKSIFAIALPKEEGKPTYTRIVNKQGEVFIIALDSVEYPTPTESEYKDLENRLNNLKIRQLSVNLMSTLRSNAEIEYGDIGIDMNAAQ